MGEDMAYRARQLAPEAPDVIIQQHIRSYVLQELQELLRDAGYSLEHFNLPQADISSTEVLINRLIMEELSYASNDTTAEVNQLITQLNSEQRHIYDIIEHSISNESGYTFFIYGYGGTGKTFLWNTLLSSVRNKASNF
jgi:chromosomal replication initiation ATPase DnaA